jgi:4,5-DOPA dioxygenase extradiol
MTRQFPTLFVSHGAPTLVVETSGTADFFRGLATRFPRPRAILCVSAHWETVLPTLSLAERPDTIHDFYGFPPELYALRYPCPGDPGLAHRARDLLASAGVEAHTHPSRGLDHGAWVPLLLAYPDARIPVVQLSVQPGLDARHHIAVGAALRPLRSDVLIVASGSATHNLRDFRGQPIDTAPPTYVTEFDAWLGTAVRDGDVDALADYATRAPHALRNHPTPEHFLPLHVALGAADNPAGELLHHEFNYGILSMAAFAWS